MQLRLIDFQSIEIKFCINLYAFRTPDCVSIEREQTNRNFVIKYIDNTANEK